MHVQKVDYHSPGAAERFTQSLRETGFGVLYNHPLPSSLLISIYPRWQAFFVDPVKHDWGYDPDRQDGYFPPEVSETAKGSRIRDLKERLRELGVL